MIRVSRLFSLLIALLVLASCGGVSTRAKDFVKQNSMYYWKTTFDLDSTERAFLEEHNIKRLYVRMFDVALEPDYLNGSPEIVPIATTKFVSEIPAGVEIVPVAYITIDALRAMHGQESEYATLIVERLLAMASFNKCGDIREIQLDSDWTESTRNSYHSLCEIVKSELSAHDIMLSLTIRLHQMRETPPPADRGVLMLYNTGALKDPNTHNSILSIEDVKPYLSEIEYPLPLDYAYPVYGWGVKFSDNKFVSIVTTEDVQIKENEHIRYERPQVSEIVEVKELVEKSFGKPVSGNILYHLDSKQLKNYTSDEIDKILTY